MTNDGLDLAPLGTACRHELHEHCRAPWCECDCHEPDDGHEPVNTGIVPPEILDRLPGHEHDHPHEGTE